MNAPSARPNSLPWRLSVAAVSLQVLGVVLIQTYMLVVLPMGEQMRRAYTRPEMVATSVVQLVAGCLFVGLVTWCTTQRWLRRHDAAGVDRPGRMVAVLLAVSAVLFVLLSAGQALLQRAFYAFLLNNKEWMDAAVGLYGLKRLLLTALPLKICGLLLGFLSSWGAVRIAAWSVRPATGTGKPAYLPRHAAWIAALTLLLWQLHASLTLGGYFTSNMRSDEMLEYALGYWLLPAAALALAAWTCLRSVPARLDDAGFGRAVAHGTFAFWLAQALGIGLALLVLSTMSWSQISRAAEANVTTVVSLLVYGALLALGCYAGAKLFYRRGKTPAGSAPL
ncbi:hypothetical protein ACOTFF_18900 [Achromobacter xylosoxidans]